MEVSFNGAQGATVELMRHWLESLDQSGDLGLVPLHTYGILCKSKDDTLFPLLCCNAGALPDGMEICNENGHPIGRGVTYVSPALSSVALDSAMDREPFRYRCERVSDLPDDVKVSLENICLFFHAEESVEKPCVTESFSDFREKLESLDEYCPYDTDIKAIRWIGTDLISDLAILVDVETGHEIVDKNQSLWAITEKVITFHKKITDRSESLPTDASDKVHSTRKHRVDALETLKKIFAELSARNIVDMTPFQTALSNLYALYGWNIAVATFHAQATPIIKALETERKILSVSRLLRILNIQLEQAIRDTEAEEVGSREYNQHYPRLDTLEAMKKNLRCLTLRA